MKATLNPKKYLHIFYTGLLLLVSTAGLRAQICQDPTDTVYALNTTGVLYPLNINDTAIGSSITVPSTGNPATNSNGLGFDEVSGKFYFFYRSSAGSVPDSQFVSYDPSSGITQVLAGFPSAAKIRSGCVNNTGSGYYTIDPNKPGPPILYYYDIGSDAWSTLTTSFLDTLGASLNSTFATLNSGDMAFDGSGNLWILASNTHQYALYEIKAPVPTAPVASVTAVNIVPVTPLPTDGKGITGLAFSQTGVLYLSTGTGDNKLYELVTADSSLTLVGTLPVDDMGADLTSCSFPVNVLSSRWLHFDAALGDGVSLSWVAVEDGSTTGYKVEYSTDRRNWQTLGFVQRTYGTSGQSAGYHFTHYAYGSHDNYYRIVQASASGVASISDIKTVQVKLAGKMYIGPNPAVNRIFLFHKDNTARYLAQVFDHSGRLVYYSILDPGEESMDITHLPKGSYFLRLTSSEGDAVQSFPFIK